MSEIHTLVFDEKERSLACVFHIPVPSAGVNLADIQWQTVMASRATGFESSVADATEQAQLTAGQVTEVTKTVIFSYINLDTTQRLAELKAAYQIEKAKVLADLQITLAYYGYTTTGD